MLYDFGELIFCIGPVFLVIFIIFGVLLVTTLESRADEKKKQKSELDDEKSSASDL